MGGEIYNLNSKKKNDRTFEKFFYDNTLLPNFLPEICRKDVVVKIFSPHISFCLMSDLKFEPRLHAQ